MNYGGWCVEWTYYPDGPGGQKFYHDKEFFTEHEAIEFALKQKYKKNDIFVANAWIDPESVEVIKVSTSYEKVPFE
jgi:hypothetical protein